MPLATIDGDAGLGHARELRERVVQRGGPDVAALEDVAGDHERVRLALDRERADAREGLALGGADARPHPRVEARAGGVEMAIRGVDDPQHGCRSLALRSAVATLRRASRRRRSPGALRTRLLAHERLVAQPVRAGVLAQRLAAPALVLLERALEPAHVRVALEHQQVRRDAVEEPAVMADDHRAAGEALERVLERAQRVDVEVVRGLVEQQQVGAAAQQLGEVQAVALAAREVA